MRAGGGAESNVGDASDSGGAKQSLGGRGFGGWGPWGLIQGFLGGLGGGFRQTTPLFLHHR